MQNTSSSIDDDPFTSDVHLEQMKRIDALRAHHGYISTYVAGAAASGTGLRNQILRGGRLWIDNCNARDHDVLKARNITAICALGDPDARYPAPPADVVCYTITIQDCHDVDLKAHFHAATSFIHYQMQKPSGRVLVHCAAGVSRSATICIAYLMRYYHLTLAAAYAVVLEARCVIDPNPGFIEQLRQWENELIFE